MTKTVTIAFVNEPKSAKGPWNIKCGDDYYKFWGSGKGSPEGIKLLQKGATVEIDYTEEENGQYTDRMISAVRSVSGTSHANTSGSTVDERSVMMLVSYAKDLVVSGMGVQDAINAIKAIHTGLRSQDDDPFAE